MSHDETAGVGTLEVHNLEPSTESYLDEILDGLESSPKCLPSKLFYDQRGSELFERICELEEYYLTRTELSIMKEHAAEMAARVSGYVVLIELGSGASVKTRILLDHLPSVSAYVPVDISREHLRQTAAAIHADYDDLQVSPVCADFAGHFELPDDVDVQHPRLVYFPGSTIGNFEPRGAIGLLKNIRDIAREGGGLLIGIDRQKDTATLEAAYNDASGVTARFNLNLLRRINSEFGADFDLHQTGHQAFYNREQGRIEMHLVSKTPQVVHLAGRRFPLAAGETICTEYSYKFSLSGFAELAAEAGFRLVSSWSDDAELFSVLYLRAA